MCRLERHQKGASACEVRLRQIKHVHAEYNLLYKTHGLHASHHNVCDASWPKGHRLCYRAKGKCELQSFIATES